MGKRLLLGYGFHTSPAFFGANVQNETIIGNGGHAITGSLAFNSIHEGYLEFAASSKWMICFSTRYYKTIYDNAKELSYNSNYSYESDNPKGYYNIRGLTYTLYFKYFGSRYVAPWGRYVMFGPTINTVKTSYDPHIMNIKAELYNSGTYTYSDVLLSNFGPKEQNYTGVNFMLGFGRSRIISNRVVIDYGCNLQLISVLAGVLDVVSDGQSSEIINRTSITPSNYIENTVKTRVRGINRFNVFLKVGILLF
jgi:hypothetical protein